MYDVETPARSRAMMSRAFGPGSSVRMSGTLLVSLARVRPLHFRFQRVLRDCPRAGSRAPRVRPDARRRRRSRAAPRGLALLDQPLDLLDRHGRLRVLGAPQRHDAKHAIELVDRAPRGIRIVAADGLGVDRRVDVAHQVENGRQPGRRVQIVHAAPPRTPRAPCRSPPARRRAAIRSTHRLEPGEAIVDAAQRLLGLLHAGPGEVQLLAVVRRQQQVAERGRRDSPRASTSGSV